MTRLYEELDELRDVETLRREGIGLVPAWITYTSTGTAQPLHGLGSHRIEQDGLLPPAALLEGQDDKSLECVLD